MSLKACNQKRAGEKKCLDYYYFDINHYIGLGANMLFLLFLVACISVLLSAAVIMTRRFHIKWTAKGHDNSAPQSSHSSPTPRIGGLSLLSLAIVAYWMPVSETSHITLMLFCTSLPVFLGGFGEDVGLNVRPKVRLLLSFVSAAIAGVILDAWITRTGIPILDLAFAFPLFSILFTLLVSGGICHSLNLVDGLNGLAVGLSITMAAALAVISAEAGDTALMNVCLMLLCALAGIFVFNFPLGKLFLGDAGAYTIGHLLTWIAILLMVRNQQVAPFALFLVFFWPIADMLFSIIRRIRNGRPIDQPDRMHFHQFVMRAIEITFNIQRSISNPTAAAIIWPLSGLPITIGVWFYQSNLLACVFWAICFTGFVFTYVVGIRAAKLISRSRRTDETLVDTINRKGIPDLRTLVLKLKA